MQERASGVTDEVTPGDVVLGVDIGGTTVKAALVDVRSGILVSERVEAETPRPATVAALGEAVQTLVQTSFTGRYELVGLGFPATVRRGIALSAVNLHKGWVEGDLGRIFGQLLCAPVWAVNDSDAAAIAEARFGAGRDVDGTLLIVTLGTGVGTTLVIDHQLVPNVELGLLSVRGRPAGARVSNRARKEQDLSWDRWAKDLDRFIHKLELTVSPDLIVIGGGVSAHGDRFLPKLTARTPVVAAALRNDAGIIGAARYAWDQVERRRRTGPHPPQVMDLRAPDEPAPARE
ncbi:MAG: polyphosphate--glucose phosphotransferase [Dehalococcoidia bacterium]